MLYFVLKTSFDLKLYDRVWKHIIKKQVELEGMGN